MLDVYLYNAKDYLNCDLDKLPISCINYLNDNNKDIVSKVSYYLLVKLLREKYAISSFDFAFNGKPRLLNCELYFNISHTKNYILIAISSSEVGVDIEHLNRKISNTLYNRTMHEEEKALFNYKNDRSYIISFIKKEAYLKRLGTGINVKLKSISSLNLQDCRLYIESSNKLLLCISSLLEEKPIVKNHL